jgi:hypothetical protein
MPPLPLQLRVLCGIGILFGSLSAMYALLIAQFYLLDHDKFVSVYVQNQDRVASVFADQATNPSPSPSPFLAADTGEQTEKVADKRYLRRGIVLPLAAINFILSMLLVAGCLRTLRRSEWGLSAFRLACLGSIPYQVLNGISVLLETREIAPLLGQSPRPIFTVAFLWAALCMSYYGWCLAYLRRPQIRSLFR